MMNKCIGCTKEHDRKSDYCSKRCYSKYSEKSIIRNLLGKARLRAKKKGISFNIGPQDIVLPKRCPILGIPLSNYNRNSAFSIDRIDSSKGYERGNIHVISHRANTLKNNGTISEFEKIFSWLKKMENNKK